MAGFSVADIGALVGPRENLKERADATRKDLEEVRDERKNVDKPFTAAGIATWIGVDRRSRNELLQDPRIQKTSNEIANLAQNKENAIEAKKSEAKKSEDLDK